jgi:hypothetical protein
VARIFVSYAREDAARARALASALEAAGHAVWWDALLAGGGSFREAIEQQIDAADVVLVLWSAHSRASRYVLDEAERAARRGVLLSLLLEGGEPPLGFGAVQGVEVSGWDGEPDGAAWRRVLDGIARVAAARGGDGPPAAPKPAPRAWRVAGSLAVPVGVVLGTALWLAQSAAGVRGSEALLGWPLLDAWALGVAAAAPVVWLGAREAAERGLPGWRPALRRSLVWYTRAVLVALVVTALAAAGGAFDGRTGGGGSPFRLTEIARATLLLTITVAAIATLGVLGWRRLRGLVSGSAPR